MYVFHHTRKCLYCGSTLKAFGRVCADCGLEQGYGQKTVSPVVVGVVIGAVALAVIWAALYFG
jgi:hypothetical protein